MTVDSEADSEVRVRLPNLDATKADSDSDSDVSTVEVRADVSTVALELSHLGPPGAWSRRSSRSSSVVDILRSRRNSATGGASEARQQISPISVLRALDAIDEPSPKPSSVDEPSGTGIHPALVEKIMHATKSTGYADIEDGLLATQAKQVAPRPPPAASRRRRHSAPFANSSVVPLEPTPSPPQTERRPSITSERRPSFVKAAPERRISFKAAGLAATWAPKKAHAAPRLLIVDDNPRALCHVQSLLMEERDAGAVRIDIATNVAEAGTLIARRGRDAFAAVFVNPHDPRMTREQLESCALSSPRPADTAGGAAAGVSDMRRILGPLF